MKNIDVSQLAELVNAELEQQFQQEMKEFNRNGDSDPAQAIVDLPFFLQDQTERFVIRLLQKVVDELNSTNA